MKTLRGGNGWKAASVLIFMAAFLGVMLLVPVLRDAPATEPALDVTVMSNVPALGSSHLQR